MTTTAIIVAAGSGSRFKSDTPKQFLEINGKSVLAHTLERFEAAPSVSCVVLVLAADLTDFFDIGPYPKLMHVVAGGTTRARSVGNGLAMVPRDTEIVAVHDGARPLVTVDEIERTIAKAKATGAACLVAPVTDTIKSVRGEEIADTLNRDKLRRALTPQAFKIEVLKKAFEGVELNEAVTDECYLVEKLGHPIAIVEGSPRNIKITHLEDLILAEALLNSELETRNS
ncbi:MAG TPA: 2-C-methyl-D-erythritol 4-phosphate cytidylyltransferase [Pyrinomonadaceae bacterium]|nr:2-C-methyl-D-erythritol 4-phosphate cytidylyltransferase [Pyrinomonadaceae bacterium]